MVRLHLDIDETSIPSCFSKQDLIIMASGRYCYQPNSYQLHDPVFFCIIIVMSEIVFYHSSLKWHLHVSVTSHKIKHRSTMLCSCSGQWLQLAIS